MRRQMGVPVAAWGVREVCDWAEHLGLGQYRKRFLHHCIGGSLLLELTEQNLKVSTCGHSSTLHHMCDRLRHLQSRHKMQCPMPATLVQLHLATYRICIDSSVSARLRIYPAYLSLSDGLPLLCRLHYSRIRLAQFQGQGASSRQ